MKSVGPWVRSASVAGKFYPHDPILLGETVGALLAAVQLESGPGPKALIAPHAGYIYSGATAASAFAGLGEGKDVIRRIILVGPSHYVDFTGVATCSAGAFETPLGAVAVDRALVSLAEQLPQVKCLDEAHAREHALEVELPFLQKLLETFTILPLTVGRATPEEVSEVLEAVWGRRETRIVISSDLSHYFEYPAARKLDSATAQDILALDGIGPTQACGAIPISGLLMCARRHGLKPKLLDLRNSGDAAGPRDRVVGYGAFSFSEP